MDTSGKQGTAKCPFCRESILSTEAIIVEPFKPGDPDSDEEGTPGVSVDGLSGGANHFLVVYPGRAAGLCVGVGVGVGVSKGG